ncbi:MAG: hypothetical protein H6718_13700 [Polyangiaceae bacterium]|nr:hypothetical protein [Polyangiaceae bacterium]MCB9605957.1 hypothetical protein [Polyangiaceae bacterium]
MNISDDETVIRGTGVVATLEPTVKEVQRALETCGAAGWSATRRTTVYP